MSIDGTSKRPGVPHEAIDWLRFKGVDHAIAADQGGGWRTTACSHLVCGGDVVSIAKRKCRACVERLKVATLNPEYERRRTP